MPKDGVGDLQDALDFLDPAAIQLEISNHIVALALVLDRVGEPPLAPGGYLLDLAPIRLIQLADLFALLLNGVIVKLRPVNDHELYRQSHNLLPNELTLI